MAIHPQANVDSRAVIAEEVTVGAGAYVGPHVRIGRGTVVYPHAFLDGWTTLGEDCQVHVGAVIGHEPQDKAYGGEETYLRVGDRTIFREYVVVHRGTAPGSATVIGRDCLFMAHSHVAHNCSVGDGVTLVNGAQLAGHVEVGDCAFISAHVLIHQFCRVGTIAMVGGLSATNQDIPPYVTCGGRPVAVTGVNNVGLRRAGKDKDVRADIKAAFKTLYRQNLLIGEALARMEEQASTDEVRLLVDFVRASRKGIIFSAMRVEDRSRSSI